MEAQATQTGCEPQVRQGHCEKHGPFQQTGFQIPQSDRIIWGQCPKCVAERNAEDAERERKRQEFEQRQRTKGRFEEATIPPRFAGKNFASYNPVNDSSSKAKRICEAYAERFSERLKAGGGLVLCGVPGTGKTHLASAVANHIIPEGYSAKFMTTLSAIRSVKSTYRKDSEWNEDDAIGWLAKFDLLILDEVGVQFGTETEAMILFEIINTRYEHMRPTVLISNLNLDELREQIGARVVDRMTEGGGALVVFDWESYRGQV